MSLATAGRRCLLAFALSAVGVLVAAAPSTATQPAGAAWMPFQAAASVPRAATSPPALPAATGTRYAGSISPFDAPLVVRRTAKRFTQIATAYETDCFFYSSVIPSSRLRKATIDRKGRFAFQVVTSLVDSPRIYWRSESYPDRIVERFSGRITKSGAKGTVRATVSFLDGSTCTTGQQRFLVAHKPGRVFGGVTNQSMPVTVELSASGQRVNHLHIAWLAPCADGGVWILSDFLTNFALAGGAFDESFQQSYPLDDGGLVTYAYRVAMKVTGRAATGTLDATVTVTDAAGAAETVCTTPTVRWSAGT